MILRQLQDFIVLALRRIRWIWWGHMTIWAVILDDTVARRMVYDLCGLMNLPTAWFLCWFAIYVVPSITWSWLCQFVCACSLLPVCRSCHLWRWAPWKSKSLSDFLAWLWYFLTSAARVVVRILLPTIWEIHWWTTYSVWTWSMIVWHVCKNSQIISKNAHHDLTLLSDHLLTEFLDDVSNLVHLRISRVVFI